MDSPLDHRPLRATPLNTPQLSSPPLKTPLATPLRGNSPSGAGSHHPFDAPAGLAELRSWPDRSALVVGSAPHAQVLASLQKYGFTPIVASPRRAESIAHEIGPFSFLILGPDALADDGDVERVRALHRYSPSALLLLGCPPLERTPELVVRALRCGAHDVIDPDHSEELNAGLRAGLAMSGAYRERVLAIGAHPDDVEIGCGGTLLDHRRRGDRITILTLSQGAVGGDRRARTHEAATAAEFVGAQLLFADLPDTEISDGIETIRLIESVVARIDPTVVYVHSRHDNHQDHRAVSTAAVSATRNVRRVFAYQSPSASNEFAPTQFAPIDSTMGAKVQLLSVFDSQHGRSYLEPEVVVSASRYWARHLSANARYAEPYEVLRSVGDLRQSVTTPAAYELAVPQAAQAALASQAAHAALHSGPDPRFDQLVQA